VSAQRFSDHFSSTASQYARHRPRYSDELFTWLASQTPHLHTAWDCGTGSGQAAIAIADHARRVIATDISASQIANAPRHPRVHFAVCAAEQTPIAERSVGLVTVAQALHWFDLDPFFAEVRRVLVRGGFFAAWSYGDVVLEGELDRVMKAFAALVQPYWPPERAHVQAGYRSLDIPFVEVTAPTLRLEQRWTMDELLGYVGTWSAVTRFRAGNPDPIPVLGRRLAELWGDPSDLRTVRWPLALRAGVAD
jgi:ubiquinone/menaquinone biosynthesis C-methylase UbiE